MCFLKFHKPRMSQRGELPGVLCNLCLTKKGRVVSRKKWDKKTKEHLNNSDVSKPGGKKKMENIKGCIVGCERQKGQGRLPTI